MCLLLVKLSTEILISSIISVGLFSIFLSLLRFGGFFVSWTDFLISLSHLCVCVCFLEMHLCSFSHLSSLQLYSSLLFLIMSLCVYTHTLWKQVPPKPEGSNHHGAKVICCEPPEMRVLEIKLRSSGKQYMLLITEPSIQPPSSDICYFCLVICIS